MDLYHNPHRIKTIYRMLLEMARGNFSYRLPLDGQDLQFDELATMLNAVAAKMQSAHYLNRYPFSNPLLSGNDTAAVISQKVQDYILNHLEEPLPSTKAFSKMFGINEFTLKENFRDILKTSIYQFYNEERLKKAHFLIQQTALPLKDIAFMCGFNDYTNFFKAFKKRYHYTPSDLNHLRPKE